MPPASASTPAAKIRARLLELLAPVASDAGYDLEDITVTSAGRRNLVRVVVDADGGVDLDAVATLSRAMSDVLDEDAGGAGRDFADPYVLEVSSPGVDPPLTEARHWRRAVGRLVEVTVDGTVVTGRVLGTDGQGVRLEVAGLKGRPATTREVAWSSLGRGKVQVEFNRKGAANEPGTAEGDEFDDEFDENEED